MRSVIRHLAFHVGISVALIEVAVLAEVPLVHTEQLETRAFDIFTGEITQIYSAVDRSSPDWEKSYRVAEIRIDRVEKGKYESPLAYVRYWNQRFVGSGVEPPGSHGYRPTPSVGEKTRVFVETAKDGGLDVIFPNGFAVLSTKATGRE